MPDTTILTRREIDATPIHELIRRERRPLPAHDLDGVNARQWALAVCGAEVAHRERDFGRVCGVLGLSFDRYDEPDCMQRGQFAHEAHAGAALNWLSHLQTHDSDRRGPWACVRWDVWTTDEKRHWLKRRRQLVHGFLQQIDKYKAARREIDRTPAIARAA